MYKDIQEILGLDKSPMDYSMEELIKLIREFHQMIIYTVDKNWVLQLLDLDTCGNDEGSCEWENDNENLMDLLREALNYISECVVERNNG